MSKVLVVGGGPAGMFAAIFAARAGHEVHLYEKNEKLGKKLFITGKGRCNITNASDMEVLFQSVVGNPKFLYSGFYSFTNDQVIDFFEALGVATKVERGNRVFPMSDHSSDVIGGLTRELRRLGVKIHLNTAVKRVGELNHTFRYIELEDKTKIEGDACIIATGGISYPSTGSTGDGYRFARELGHQVTKLYPSLVPMEVKEDYVRELQGLSLRNVEVRLYHERKKVYDDFGEMLFTHYGVSGPLIISASALVGTQLAEHTLRMEIDLKPALSFEQLDARLLRDFEECKNKQFKNALDKLFPAKLKPVMLAISDIPMEKKVNEISREERHGFVNLIKHFPLTVTGLRGYNEAIITKGGIRVKDVDPGTMESRLVRGLYFAGEVLDLDALTGGFNLQIAWSTGYLAGVNAGNSRPE
ncbi:BaiN/RdsA family NAD(P)/FAD-dependent oxidoreductase [Hespellia stercorisuis]|uniref:NAD(P)/FAD-dependent oxidoreductase n=1 Tax=Hespellia stercorisuis DSM 15480 TaxID=1121950 RepID=A0A1M6HIR8_9FIRM|nr:NAD(P)/FAD-dependent oxidoreductase [Hespellia stercorisuis]SHJ22077.1 hypothetical protein SAMN02745243_00033 [Hespellia stercorisuis DSM 15480]